MQVSAAHNGVLVLGTNMWRYVNHGFGMLDSYPIFVFWESLATLLLNIEQMVHLFQIGPLMGKILDVVCQGYTPERGFFNIDEILGQFSLPLI